MARKKAGRYDPKKGSKKLKDLLVEIDDTIKAGGDPVKAAEQLEKGKPSNKLKINKSRNPILVAAEEWKKANPNKTLAEYRKLNPDVPPLKIKSGKNQPLSIALKTKGTTDSEKLRKVKQVQSPGITAAEKAKRKKLFDTVEWMRHVDPDGGWNIEHVERVKDFDGKKFGISHKADDLPNLKINSGTDAKHKTAWESFGDKWDSWNASVYHDDVIVYNRSEYDPQFPEKAIKVKPDDFAAHKQFLESGSLKGATPQNKKAIKFLLSERAPSNLPLEKQRAVFLENAAKDKNISKATRSLSKKLLKPLGVMTAASLAALGPLGTAASAADTTQRFNKARQTRNPLDMLQTGLAGASTATGWTGAGEIIATPADSLNLLIDGFRNSKRNKDMSNKERLAAVNRLKFIK